MDSPKLLKSERLALVPDVLPISLEDMKLDLRVDSDDEDITILQAMMGAADYVEIRTAYRLTPASYRAVGGVVSACPVAIHKAPFRQLTSVEYWNSESKLWQDVPWSAVFIETNGRETIVALDSESVGDLEGRCDSPYGYSTRYNFLAGFDGTSEETSVAGQADPGLLLAYKALVALWYEKREAGQSAGTWAGQDPAKDVLLQAYRWFW